MSPAAVEVWSFDADEAESGGGRGQRATRPISTGDVVLSVPLQQCWTAAAALSSPLLSCLAGGVPCLGERDIIALHLLAERFDADARASTDERAAHVTSLPERYDVPMLWSEDEIDNLAGSEHHMLARRLRKAVEADYWALDNLLQEAGGEAAGLFEAFCVTMDGYRWARAALQTRSTQLKLVTREGDGETQTALCLPGGGADQFNHSPDIRAECFRLTADGMLEVVAAQDYAAGDEVFISYGADLSTAQMLFTYGFAYADNLSIANLGTPLQSDYVTITFSVPAVLQSSLEAARYGLLLEAVAGMMDEEGSEWTMEAGEEEGSVVVELRLRPVEPVLRCWLVAARVMALSEAQVGALQESDELLSKVLSGKPVTADNEAEALDSMSLKLMSRLDGYGGVTSRLLSNLGDTRRDTRRDRLAVNLQLVEKAILQRALDVVGELKATISEQSKYVL